MHDLWGWITASFIAGIIVGAFFRMINKHSNDDQDDP